MIGMVMRKENRMHSLDFFAQQLQTKFGGRIDEEVALWCANENGAAITVVARIARHAHVAVTPDHGHPDGCAGTQERERSQLSRHCTPYRKYPWIMPF